MDLWKELTDFSNLNTKIPCVLCKEWANPTVTNTHYKCSVCDHLFNEDKSELPKGVKCYCKVCSPERECIQHKNKKGLKDKTIEKVKKLLKGTKKTNKRKISQG